ncbi:uncharacterized protein UV8b_01284 [Ustilaginoidea virens]|uniref:Uncharacterized protein n=1 Tax=Ustilaginoidea virens TaxID=1159556 RepID=A0A8E5ME88_USTVR|nr:uncharacterized protein UV8b_01284 [Ustilaginoidea virens]QUC17043.1 hypothetical protein UV8b_01284 [Ustilaginoidea virens]
MPKRSTTLDKGPGAVREWPCRPCVSRAENPDDRCCKQRGTGVACFACAAVGKTCQPLDRSALYRAEVTALLDAQERYANGDGEDDDYEAIWLAAKQAIRDPEVYPRRSFRGAASSASFGDGVGSHTRELLDIGERIATALERSVVLLQRGVDLLEMRLPPAPTDTASRGSASRGSASTANSISLKRKAPELESDGVINITIH